MEHLTLYTSKWGNLSLLANALGVTPAAVKHWRRVPAERVLAVEKFTGISRHDLRPDLYPLDDRERQS